MILHIFYLASRFPYFILNTSNISTRVMSYDCFEGNQPATNQNQVLNALQQRPLFFKRVFSHHWHVSTFYFKHLKHFYQGYEF
ncbi:hypothetical protein TSAR_016493 [Trichomalopsis sarcophagae]|uniref:Uncharacterized protein n=1 Tax=Trichomalopsis sarcophagae TaxID=543379 RepID=A0A232EE86_9HYME|nr:hypothetical protein TSAR_016493 [Trichomalopsis sarcophagae]